MSVIPCKQPANLGAMSISAGKRDAALNWIIFYQFQWFTMSSGHEKRGLQTCPGTLQNHKLHREELQLLYRCNHIMK